MGLDQQNCVLKTIRKNDKTKIKMAVPRAGDRVREQQGDPGPHLPVPGEAGGQRQAGGGHAAAAGATGLID